MHRIINFFNPFRISSKIRKAKDYLTTRAACKYFRTKYHPSFNSKKILIVNLGTGTFRVKIDAIIACALKFKGANPIIVLRSKKQKVSIMYFRLFGLNTILYLEDYISELQSDDLHFLNYTIGNKFCFQKYLQSKVGSSNIGKNVLSTLAMRLRKSNIDFENEKFKSLLKHATQDSLLFNIAARSLIAQVKPDMAIFGEKGYSPYGEVFDNLIDIGIPAIQVSQSHISDGLILKRYSKANASQHPFSLSLETWEKVKHVKWTKDKEEDLKKELEGRYQSGTWFSRKYTTAAKKIKSKNDVIDQLRLDATKKIAIIFSHVLWDATFFFGTSLFDDYEHWLVETAKVACKNDSLNWIIKIHPDYVWKLKQIGDINRPRDFAALKEQVGELPEHVKIMEPETDINTFSLFQVADYCLTVRGTIGIEMPCYGINVITAGTGRYSGLGFTIDFETRNDYLDTISQIQDIPPMNKEKIDLAKKHAYHLLKSRVLPIDSFTFHEGSIDKLDQPSNRNIELNVDSLEDFINQKDLNIFSDWILNSQEPDYFQS